ncbi:MAG: tetratricopeptide repeat protein [bacterium]|nr:tetratricopeptide repeat protein [bacterium]
MKRPSMPFRCALLIAGLLTIALVAAAQNPQGDLGAAEKLYRSGDYQGAADVYQNLLRQGWANGELYYNLGNCFFKTGRYGQAILNYERARLFLGKDPDLEINLKLANLRIFDRIEPLPRVFFIKIVESVGGWFSVRRWGTFLIAIEWLLLACLVALHLLRDPKARKLFVGGFFVLATAMIIAGGFFWLEKISQDRRTEAIVLVNKADVRSAPEAGATELFTLHDGAKLTVLREVSGWAEIRLADGKQGWLQLTAFEEI